MSACILIWKLFLLANSYIHPYILGTFAQPVACVELEELIIFSVDENTEDGGTTTTENKRCGSGLVIYVGFP